MRGLWEEVAYNSRERIDDVIIARVSEHNASLAPCNDQNVASFPEGHVTPEILLRQKDNFYGFAFHRKYKEAT